MGKLVRDNIPAIIEAQGKTPKIRILELQEYCCCLEAKLDEEVAEFHTDRNLEELADILEVVYALAASRGISQEALMGIYHHKHAQRGGFTEKLLLIASEK